MFAYSSVVFKCFSFSFAFSFSYIFLTSSVACDRSTSCSSNMLARSSNILARSSSIDLVFSCTYVSCSSCTCTNCVATSIFSTFIVSILSNKLIISDFIFSFSSFTSSKSDSTQLIFCCNFDVIIESFFSFVIHFFSNSLNFLSSISSVLLISCLLELLSASAFFHNDLSLS